MLSTMKPRPPSFSDTDDHHHHRYNNNNEELTPLMLPRHAGKRTPPVSYFHYGDTTSNHVTLATAATLPRGESLRHLHDKQQQEQHAAAAAMNHPAVSSSSSLFVAQIYSHRNGSTYIRYQLEKNQNNSSSNDDDNSNDNDSENKKCRCSSSCPYYYDFHRCSHRQRRCCIASWTTLIVVFLVFLGAGRALFHHNNNSISSSTTSTTGSGSSFRSSNVDITTTSSSSVSQHNQSSSSSSSSLYSRVPRCSPHGMPCFYPGRIQVQSHHRQQPQHGHGVGVGDGFPSYWDYAGPMNVTTYNNDGSGGDRSNIILINGDRVLFLSGSMHPSRATRASWELALDEAVRNGLNLVTIDVFWSAHQPFRDSPFDWSMSSQYNNDDDDDDYDDWQLKDALYSCASRGLFVHLRMIAASGGEYSFGGIPEWLGTQLQYPNLMQMSSTITSSSSRLDDDAEWQTALTGFLKATIDYMQTSQLWAFQGGPIIMAQVETELVQHGDGVGGIGTDKENNNDDDDLIQPSQQDVVKTTALRHGPQPLAQASTAKIARQAYADWCCAIVANLSPTGVVWTMCNDGLSANHATSTLHGDRRLALKEHGEYSGRAALLWTVEDGGFQQWGGGQQQAATDNRNTAAGMSYAALQWFARGGTHLNYYMWWGGYNRGRPAAASALNAHDTHAVLCPSGERHHPKFAHFQALHTALAEIAPVLLHAAPVLSAALGGENNKVVQIMNDQGHWELGQDQSMFVYKSNEREAIFVENNLDAPVVARVPCSVGVSSSASSAAVPTMVVLEMQPHSSILLIDGMVRFDSGTIQPRAMAFARRYIRQPVILLDWSTWQEPVGVVASTLSSSPLDSAAAIRSGVHMDTRPLEQTALIMNDTVLSDYAWYQTTFTVENHLDIATLRVDTQKANGIVAFLDGKYIDAADNHERSQGATSLYLSLGSLKTGTHQLALLSESFGYSTLMSNSPNQNTGAVQLKGITGDVILSSPSLRHNMNLVDGNRQWLSFAGLHAERVPKDSSSSSSSSSLPLSGGVWREHLQNTLQEGWGSIPTTASWSAAYFDSPRYDPSTQGLFLHIRSGRGHLWLNGRDLGRYWNITRGGGGGDGNTAYSQEYYFLPNDYLYGDSGRLNEIVLFDVFGGNHGESELVLSWTEAASDDEPSFMDEVDFPGACLV